jgi:hypothetical protein
MDFGLIIIAIIIIAICIVPFIIMARNNKKKEQQILQALSDLAGKYKYTISQYDLWNHAAIGTDEGMNMIFFTKKNKIMESIQQVVLEDVQRCRIINSSRSVGNKGGHSNVIDKLDLAFTYQDRTKAETIFNIFDVDGDSLTVTKELYMAEKWNRLINEKINAFALKA